MLADHDWEIKYTSADGNLVNLFYVPALKNATRYDRLTGYFNAGALALAARGIESLVRNRGRMRLIVGCTLDDREIEAIEKGEALRDQVRSRLTAVPLAPPDPAAEDALELLSWMVADGYLDVQVAVPCDATGHPVNDTAIFHEKTGIIEDRTGNRIAWTGSLNETAAGWQRNWESISVFTSWTNWSDAERVVKEETSFARLWSRKTPHLLVLDVPDAVRRDLMRFLPDELPARLKGTEVPPREDEKPPPPPARPPAPDRRALVWSFIQQAPRIEPGGSLVGEATSAVTPWPHQVRAFEKLYGRWPPKLLIADEVGLGKTIQAGMLLRQAWLAGTAKRILILAPKAVLSQWQIELREKFNLNWPIYDGRKLLRYPSPALRGNHEREITRSEWHTEPAVIASSHLMRRRDRVPELIEDAEPWDLIIVDEAHHARRRAAGAAREGGPNALLALMRALKERTEGLVLLTATPMQVAPVELWDLLDLLGLPPEWTERAFLRFFEDVAHPNPSHEAMERMAALFRSVERDCGKAGADLVARLTSLSGLKGRRVLKALRDDSTIPRRRLETNERRAALAVMRAHTPIRHLVSRHTRELLRRYFKAGMLSTPIADREVRDEFVEMTVVERELYHAVEDYISTTYNQASASERGAVGFVMTIYRRRLASSFAALRATLDKHLATIEGESEVTELVGLDEDTPDDEAGDDVPDPDELAALERDALAAEERGDIEELLRRVRECPPDSKLGRLKETLAALRADGYEQAMVFTQYTDTMRFLRHELRKNDSLQLMCFSGTGGEIPTTDGAWRPIDRDDTKRRFRRGEADILLCTDAAAEGLNFQFCGSLVNYDMPWNPMRVEQRIGRIDRLGQQHRAIRVVNLHYEDTVETDVYRALRERINLFETVVGRLQPILARLPGTIADTVLAGHKERDASRANALENVEQHAREVGQGAGFDLDEVLAEDLTMPERARPRVTLDDLDRVIGSSGLMPPGTEVRAMGHRQYGLLAPGMDKEVRVTTSPDFYDEHAENVELWSPGSPLFDPPQHITPASDPTCDTTLEDLLNRYAAQSSRNPSSSTASGHGDPPTAGVHSPLGRNEP